MKKELIRREFFNLRLKGHSYVACQRILKARFEFEASVRTLKRWAQRLERGGWDLRDESRRPHMIHRKITPAVEQEVIRLREKTGWGAEKLHGSLQHLNISEMSMHRILRKHDFCRKTKSRGKRVKWVRWQRAHPNSLWQIDHTDEQDKHHCYTLSVVDDCSRYSLALVKLQHVTTNNVTHILEDLINVLASQNKSSATTEALTEEKAKTADSTAGANAKASNTSAPKCTAPPPTAK